MRYPLLPLPEGQMDRSYAAQRRRRRRHGDDTPQGGVVSLPGVDASRSPCLRDLRDLPGLPYTPTRRQSHSHSPPLSFSSSSTLARFTLARSILALLLLCILSLPLVSSAPNCLRFADSDSINQLFIDGGPGTKVHLCPSKLYRLSGTIVFTAADQELATAGYPTGAERATIRVEGSEVTAIQGDCRRCARVGVRSMVIDGNRRKKGRGILDTGGLVVLGGNEGQTITDCKIRDPRGFTAIHYREGDKMSCTGAVIEKNEIGPVGDEYDPKVDGPDPELSELGRPLAAGLSMACKDSVVRDNTFIDNTDASIVLYCSPGTVVSGNRISARKVSAMAGILMVDSTPWNGDYTGTIVKGNTIDAASRTIRVGIGLGSAVWSDDVETVLKGGTVQANTLKGKWMGYGIAAAGLKGWTVKDNFDEAGHQGKRSARCFDEPINPDPMAFLYTKSSITESTFQSGFEDHIFQYAVCIDGTEDSKAAEAVKPIEGSRGRKQVPAEAKGAKGKTKAGPAGAGAGAGAKDNSQEGQQKQAKPGSPGSPGPAPGPGPAAEAGKAPVKAGAKLPVPLTDDEDPEDDSGVSGMAKVADFDTGSEVLDGALLFSQLRMIDAIESLGRRMAGRLDEVGSNSGGAGGAVGAGGAGTGGGPSSSAISALRTRIEALEGRQHALLEITSSLRTTMQKWHTALSSSDNLAHKTLHSILSLLPLPGPDSSEGDADTQALLEAIKSGSSHDVLSDSQRDELRARVQAQRERAQALPMVGGGWVSVLGRGLGGCALAIAGWAGWSRWRGRRGVKVL